MTPSNSQDSAQLLALDWGTSALRAVLLDSQGQVLRQHSSGNGILNIPDNGFAPFFEANFEDWMSGSGIFCLISGMAGSQQGWAEAPYCPCPAGFDELAAHLKWVDPGRIAIVPGLSCLHPGPPRSQSLQHIPDVMRGEEVQVFGALHILGMQDALMVLPGTHSKWVQVKTNRVQSFQTCMTGEMFALLRQHSILSRTLPALPNETGSAAHAELDTAAFDEAVMLAMRASGLLQTAFSTRTLGLWKTLSPTALVSHLSGLVIGEELRCQHLAPGTEVVVIGSDALRERYGRALELIGMHTRSLGSEATWHGLFAVHKALKLHRPD
jgi:2-dehydro-3-deoxygalactonokinase